MVIIGLDEAGRGPWAGPVFAGLVILNPQQDKLLTEKGLRDSKKMTKKKRAELYHLILENSLYAKVKYFSASEIDRIGIYIATQELMKQLVKELTIANDGISIQDEIFKDYAIQIDGLFPKMELLDSQNAPVQFETIIKGDDKVTAISAASVLAKVRRDLYMEELDKKYPEYQFAKHKGYGTKLHFDLLKKLGPCEEHRRSFKPVGKLLNLKH